MTKDSEYIEGIQQAIIDGDNDTALAKTQDALNSGVDSLLILNEGLTKGADIVGQYFENGTFFLPNLMLTGRALKAAMEIVLPAIKEQHPDMQSQASGVVVIATIQTDVHDIGKNLVASMLIASGFTVHDLGVDVPIDTIINKALEVNADLICASSLLTTSTPFLGDLISVLDARGVRDRFGVLVGGAPVTSEFANEIGADGTAANALGAVRLAKEVISSRKSVS